MLGWETSLKGAVSELDIEKSYFEIHLNLNLKWDFISLIPFTDEKGKLKNGSSIYSFGKVK